MRLILAVHAFSGCDTVSGIFCIGKTKLTKQLEDVKLGATLEPLIEVFLQCDSIPDALLSAGSMTLYSNYTSDRSAGLSGTGLVWKESGANRLGMGTRWCWETYSFSWLR